MPTAALLQHAEPCTKGLSEAAYPMLCSMSTMPRQQNLHQGGFMPYPPPLYPSSTDSDSLDSMSTEAQPGHDFGDQQQHATDEHFFVGELELDHLDPWRRNVPSPMPRITDAITQGMSCCYVLSSCCSRFLLLLIPVSASCTPYHQPQPQLHSTPPFTVLSPIRSASAADIDAARRAWLRTQCWRHARQCQCQIQL